MPTLNPQAIVAVLLLPMLALPAAAIPPQDATVTVLVSCGAVCTFDPPVITIPPGTTVQWVMVNTCHTITNGFASGAGPVESLIPHGPLEVNAFDSGFVCVGNTFSYTFQTAGKAYPYYCNPHQFSGQHGSVQVA